MDYKDAITILSAVCAIVFGYLAFVRNKKADDKKAGSDEGMIMAEIGYIKANTDEIKLEQKEQRKSNLEFVSRLTQVETDLKNALVRINQIERAINHE